MLKIYETEIHILLGTYRDSTGVCKPCISNVNYSLPLLPGRDSCPCKNGYGSPDCTIPVCTPSCSDGESCLAPNTCVPYTYGYGKHANTNNEKLVAVYKLTLFFTAPIVNCGTYHFESVPAPNLFITISPLSDVIDNCIILNGNQNAIIYYVNLDCQNCATLISVAGFTTLTIHSLNLRRGQISIENCIYLLAFTTFGLLFIYIQAITLL